MNSLYLLPLAVLAVACGLLTRTQAATPTLMGVKQIIAHRGASAECPENTLASVRQAIDSGATAIEVDVRLTKDRQLVILHDATLERTTNGNGMLLETSLAEVRALDAGSWFGANFADERVPTLREVLGLCSHKADVLLDLKDSGPDFVRQVVSEVTRHGVPERTIVGVRTVEQARRIRSLLPNARQLGLIPDPDAIEAFAEAGVDTIRLWPRWLADGPESVRRVRDAKVQLHLNRTTGEQEEVQSLLASKPDSLSSDDPAQLVKTLAELQSHNDSRHDSVRVIWSGESPNKLACDTTLRQVPDGSWVMIMLGGGDREPLPANRIYLTRSTDRGTTWSSMEPIDFGVKQQDPNRALVPTELMVHQNRCTIFFATHDGHFGDWKTWMCHSTDSCRSWGQLMPAPGKLAERTFIRNTIVTRNGALMLPFQHYVDGPGPRNPRNGVIISHDHGISWSVHGWIRLSADDGYRGWAEPNIVELAGGRISMIIRADRLGGVLFQSDSSDGGKSWSKPYKTMIPNPGSKATLYRLGEDTVALLHNPHPRQRNPLSLWISFDAMRTWPYRRELVNWAGRLNYPDGFVSGDQRSLHFAFDDNRHRAVYVKAHLPPRTAPGEE